MIRSNSKSKTDKLVPTYYFYINHLFKNKYILISKSFTFIRNLNRLRAQMNLKSFLLVCYFIFQILI